MQFSIYLIAVIFFSTGQRFILPSSRQGRTLWEVKWLAWGQRADKWQTLSVNPLISGPKAHSSSVSQGEHLSLGKLILNTWATSPRNVHTTKIWEPQVQFRNLISLIRLLFHQHNWQPPQLHTVWLYWIPRYWVLRGGRMWREKKCMSGECQCSLRPPCETDSSCPRSWGYWKSRRAR